MDAPSWMYLPHLGCGGGEVLQQAHRLEDEHAEERRLHASDGTLPYGAAAAEIRGRGEAPGIADRAGQPRGAGAIRGRANAPGAASVNKGARGSAASATTEAARKREAAMARYFADLDDRAAARKRRLEETNAEPRMTPNQRIEALRRRIAARAGGGGTGASGIIGGANGVAAGPGDPRPHQLQGASDAAARAVAWHTEAAADGAAVVIPNVTEAAQSSNEDAKMHQNLVGMVNAGAAEETVGRPSPAAAAAAARHAWHAAEARPPTP